MAESFLNGDRTKELWLAIKTLLSDKVDLSTLEDYATADAVATAITTALTNYATDSDVTSAITTALADYMTATEVNEAIAAIVVESSGIKFELVDELPETGEENIIYLVPNGQSGSNIKDEYMWVNNNWEVMGSTSIDLSNYWSRDDLNIMTAEELQEILV